MKNFKKYIAALLIFALALSLCSCSLIDRLKPCLLYTSDAADE